jgi:Uma2 family endonuclease
MKHEVRESQAAYGGTRRHMTVREYYLAAKKGVFKPGERLELIRGEVIQKVSPQRSLHSVTTSLVARHVSPAFGQNCYVRQQMPVGFDEESEPEPDVAVVSGIELDFAHRHPGPTEILLIVEVSDTTLRFDRGKKARIYAEFGIPEYWIVNLRDRELEVFLGPGPDGYAESVVLGRAGEVTPQRGIGKSIRVGDLIPAL